MIPGTSALAATEFFGELVIQAWAAMLEHENRKKPEDVAQDAFAYASALAPKLMNLHFNARQHDEAKRAAAEPAPEVTVDEGETITRDEAVMSAAPTEPAPPPELDEHPEIQDADVAHPDGFGGTDEGSHLDNSASKI